MVAIVPGNSLDENISVSIQHYSIFDFVVRLRGYKGAQRSEATSSDSVNRFYIGQNVSGDSLQVTNIVVVDSLGTRIEPRHNRKELVKGTKESKRRYKGEGLEVKAGVSGTVLLGAGVVAAAGTSGLGAAAMAGGGAAAGAAAVVVLVPVLAVGGVFRGINNSKVNDQIESRQTLLPIVLEEKEEKNLILFFPLAPSPRQIELTFVDSRGEHKLIIDTGTSLEGLHLVQSRS